MAQTVWQHIIFFLFAVTSTGSLFGLSLLEENLGLAVYTFTTGCISFSVVGLLLHINLLNMLIKKIKLYATLGIAVGLQQIAMILCYFPQITAFSYIAAILLAGGNSLCYASLFFLFCEYKQFSVLLGVAFAFSTMLFYITQLNRYCIAVVQGVQLFMFLLFRVPKDLYYYFYDFQKTRFSMSQLVSVSVFAGCFSKNILTNLFFSYSSNQLVFSLGLLMSIFSGVLLFNLRIGIIISSIMCTTTCILYYVNNLYAFCVGFYIANLACSAMISAAFSINAQDGYKSNNTLVYLAMILGNCSGFFKNSSPVVKHWIFGVCGVLCLVGILSTVKLPSKQSAHAVEDGSSSQLHESDVPHGNAPEQKY